MFELKQRLRDGLSFSGDVTSKTPTIVTDKPKQEMDYYTVRCLFYIAAHKDIRNCISYTITEKDLEDLGLSLYQVIDCLADLSNYCIGVVDCITTPMLYNIVADKGEITVMCPYFHYLFNYLLRIGSPQDIINAIDDLVRGVI